jgi:hypothetical protein
MPELMEGAILFGVLTAILGRLAVNRRIAPRRLPLLGIIALALVGAFAGPPVFLVVRDLWLGAGLPHFTGGAAFIGAWLAAIALFVFERKGQPRRVPIWVAVVVGFGGAIFVPPLIDRVTGTYQNASLRADVNHCTSGMTGQVQPRSVTNTCDEPITVGLCMPGEVNPEPCAQSITIAPGETATLDPGDARLSSVPGNPGGLTVVACRPPSRPSRWGNVTGRGYRGVCLPAG